MRKAAFAAVLAIVIGGAVVLNAESTKPEKSEEPVPLNQPGLTAMLACGGLPAFAFAPTIYRFDVNKSTVYRSHEIEGVDLATLEFFGGGQRTSQ